MNQPPTIQLVGVISRNLTPNEIVSYHRYQFVQAVLDFISDKETYISPLEVHVVGGRKARFVAVGKHANLVEIEQRTKGEWEFSIAHNFSYSYHLSDVIEFIEGIFDRGAEIISLKDEIDLSQVYTPWIASQIREWRDAKKEGEA